MSFENSTANEKSMRYQMFNGVKEYQFEIEEGKPVSVEVTIDSQGGTLDAFIAKDGNQANAVYTGNAIPTSHFTVDIEEAGKYLIHLSAEKHRGSYTFNIDEKQETTSIAQQSTTTATTAAAAMVEQTTIAESTTAIPFMEAAAKECRSVLTDIQENTRLGSAGASLTAVQIAARMMNWGVGTHMSPEQVTAEAGKWYQALNQSQQKDFQEKFSEIYTTYQQLLGDDASDREWLETAGVTYAAYPWSNQPIETIEAIAGVTGISK